MFQTRTHRWFVVGLFVVGLAGLSAEAQTRAGASAPVEITNFQNGETIRYPLAFLEGTLADEQAQAVQVINRSSDRDTRELNGLAHQGRFKALAELVEGENRLIIRSGDAATELTLYYKPQTNPHYVRAVFLTDNTGDTTYQTPVENDAQDYEGKFDTALKLMQTFTAEWMNRRGYGRRTFNLELDENGDVVVHVVRLPKAAADYYKGGAGRLVHLSAVAIDKSIPDPNATNLVMIAFSRFDPETRKNMAYTALGGGNIALFGGSCMYSWPNRLTDAQAAFRDATPINTKLFATDSVGRNVFWANSATTIGAALHELGHCFALPHTTFKHDIMTRGIDRLNRFFTFVEPPHAKRDKPYQFHDDEIACWSPVSAAALAPRKAVALDARSTLERIKATFSLDESGETIIVEHPQGIGFVGYEHPGRAKDYIPIDYDGSLPTRVEVPVASISEKLRESGQLRILDAHGRMTTHPIAPILAGE